MKNIIIVADENLKKNGRELVHALSKTGTVKAVLYSPKQYVDNENQVTGNQYVIFLGNDSDVAQDFGSLISPSYDKMGAVWGYDGPKAIILCRDIQVPIKEIVEELKKEKKELEASLVQDSSVNNLAIAVGGGASGAGGLLMTSAFWTVAWPGLIGMFFFKLIKSLLDKGAEKEKRRSFQFQLAQLMFLRNGFDKFIGE